MPRVRFTVRRLMIAVAVFALVLGGLVARGGIFVMLATNSRERVGICT